MELEQANELVNKSMNVILSCKTSSRLEVGVKYADLVYKKISNNIGLLNDTRFISLIERSIGFAQCQIKNRV